MSANPLPALRNAVAGPGSAAAATLFATLPGRLRRPVSGGAYRPEIDGLRFLAITIVVLGHLAERLVRLFPTARDAADGSALGHLLQRPGLGVFLFFTVSGFILASQAQRAQAHPLSPAFLRRYFGRRVLRIEPPYLLLLVGTFLLIVMTGFRPKGTHQFETAPQSIGASLAGSLVYLHDLIWGTYPRLFPPGWSLEVEVQFYVLAPLFFALCLGPMLPAARVAIGAVGLFAGSLLSLLAPASVGPVHLDASIVRFLHFFWLGLILAQAQPWLAVRLQRVSPRIAAVSGWGGLVVYLLLPNAPVPDGAASLATGMLLRLSALGSVAAMFVAVSAPRSSFRSFCALPWVSLIGGACYSVYLTHLQVIQVATVVATKVLPSAGLAALSTLALAELALVIACGLAFYTVVERTFMRPDWPQALRRVFASKPSIGAVGR